MRRERLFPFFHRSQAIGPEGSWLFVRGLILNQRGEVAAVVAVLLAAALPIPLSKNRKKTGKPV
jgi:hypothetical protein